MITRLMGNALVDGTQPRCEACLYGPDADADG